MSITTDSAVMQVCQDQGEIGLDCDAEERPLGHAVYPTLPFAIISKSRGNLGFVGELEEMVPWMRMLVLRAQRSHLPLDLRGYHWNPVRRLWEVCLREVEVN